MYSVATFDGQWHANGQQIDTLHWSLLSIGHPFMISLDACENANVLRPLSEWKCPQYWQTLKTGLLHGLSVSVRYYWTSVSQQSITVYHHPCTQHIYVKALNASACSLNFCASAHSEDPLSHFSTVYVCGIGLVVISWQNFLFWCELTLAGAMFPVSCFPG